MASSSTEETPLRITTSGGLPRETGEPPEVVLFRFLKDFFYKPESAKLALDELPENFRDFGRGLAYFAECVAETREFAAALSRGNLKASPPSRGNDIAAPLKSLHASLKHLTWQTREVAKGDYKQRVNFMGDFSDSFNSMIEQLSQSREALLQEIESGRKKSDALTESNNLLEAITEQISQWIIVIGEDSGEWLYANRGPRDVLKNAGWEDDLRAWLRGRMSAPRNENEPPGELELPFSGAPENARQYFSVVAHSIYWHGREAAAFVLTDVSLDKKRLRKLETVAYHDPLTKTFNRRYGMEILLEWLSEGRLFVICFIDLDNLKYVNDKFGHGEGDKYILHTVDLLRHFSEKAVLCRLGGDEFMILADEISSGDAEARLEELRSRLLGGEAGVIGANIRSLSYGVIEVQADSSVSASELLSLADEKMYQYKRLHKMARQSSIAAIEKK
ncbi:MAG: diguanylate cyclase [Synergistaceae bacterium]|jgi:diguanylate cyclase (GGDEF)-like protein|nr:diguanylate cyclase [Synergistaceae bacterium]